MKTPITENPIKRQIYVSIAVIILTAIILGFVFGNTNTALKEVASSPIPTVEIITAHAENLTIPLQARGIVEPEKQIALVSQIVGTVTQISENFDAGSSFRKGDILLQADTTYLNMELQKAKAAYSQAIFHELEVKAQIEAGSLIQDNDKNSALAKGEPQLAVATSAKEAALAAMQAAQKQMDAATLRAPFNGRVMARNIQEQEQLIIGRPLAQIYSTDSYRIRFPVTQEQFTFIEIPSKKNPAPLSLIITNENTQQQWRGNILRSEGYIAANRMIYVIAEVLADKSTLDEVVPGSLLKIEMPGKLMNNIITLPAKVLQDNNSVWIMTADNRLQSKAVEILHRNTDTVYITSGIANGDKVVLNPISGMTENMLIKAQNAASTEIDSIKDTP